jgi:hypothetical protein
MLAVDSVLGVETWQKRGVRLRGLRRCWEVQGLSCRATFGGGRWGCEVAGGSFVALWLQASHVQVVWGLPVCLAAHWLLILSVCRQQLAVVSGRAFEGLEALLGGSGFELQGNIWRRQVGLAGGWLLFFGAVVAGITCTTCVYLRLCVWPPTGCWLLSLPTNVCC